MHVRHCILGVLADSRFFKIKLVYSFVQNFWRFSTTVDDDRSDSSTPFNLVAGGIFGL